MKFKALTGPSTKQGADEPTRARQAGTAITNSHSAIATVLTLSPTTYPLSNSAPQSVEHGGPEPRPRIEPFP